MQKKYFTKAEQKAAKARKDNKWAQKHYYTESGRGSRLVSTAKARAKVKGREFNLTVEWGVAKIKAGVCELTGLPFDLGSPTGKGSSAGPRPYAPSIDRIDPNIGYTPENSRMILNCVNAFKNIMPDDEMYIVAQALVKERS